MTDHQNERRAKGTGSITERKNGWEAAITFNGKRRTKLFATYEEAERWLKAMIEARAGRRPAPLPASTVNDYLNELLKKRTASEEETVKKTSGEMRLIRELLGEMHVSEVTEAVLRDFWARINGYEVVGEQLERIPGCDGQGLSRRALVRIRTHLRSALDLAVGDGVIAHNSARPHRSDTDPLPIPRDRSRVKALDPGLILRWLQGAKEHRLYPLFLFMLSVGVRVSEARVLTWNDLDVAAGRVTINKMATGKTSRPAITTHPKTDNSHRVVPVPRSIIELLQEHRQAQLEACAVLGDAYSNPHLMFTNETGGILTSHVINRHIAQTIGPLLPEGHDMPTSKWLRATYASLALRAGIKIEVVSERLGHASVIYTFMKYRHLYFDEGHGGVLSAEEMISQGNRSLDSFQGDSWGFLTSAVVRAFDVHTDREETVLTAVVGTPGEFITRLARELGVSPAVLADSLARLSSAHKPSFDGDDQIDMAA